MWDTGSEHGSDWDCVKKLKKSKNISQHNRLRSSFAPAHRPPAPPGLASAWLANRRAHAARQDILEAVLRVYAAARGPRVHAAPPTGATGTASHEPARRGPEDTLHRIIDW